MAVAIGPGVGLGLACGERRWAIGTADPITTLTEIAGTQRPRWLWWGRDTSDLLAAHRVPIDRCLDIATVHRLLHGTWRAPVDAIWAWHRGLPVDGLPRMGQLGLLDATIDEGDPENPIRPDGYLRPEWLTGHTQTPERLATWAALILDVAASQDRLVDERADARRTRSTAHAESAADLLCAEMTAHGLPVDVAAAEQLLNGLIGPRPTSPAHEEELRAHRDEGVWQTLEPRWEVNLRNPGEVRSMLRRQGHDLPDTRAWRLEQLRDRDPVVDALLTWRKTERIATTYGWTWLDEHVANDRLRGEWASADGAAGRMTASAGMHNLPGMMRAIVAAEPGHRIVRADLGQIEPRVLAAVSGDEAFIEATREPDLYQPIADRLGVSREIAKVAVLGAMYGATTGASAGALRGLERNYPTAMQHLETAAAAGKRSEDVFTVGGRRIRMGTRDTDGDIDQAMSDAAARGRYARNAIIQGAAAEFFKVWAITVRRHARAFGGEIVLCLHDELLLHAPSSHAEEAAGMVHAAVDEAAHWWSPRRDVRFVADVSVVDRWSEAK